MRASLMCPSHGAPDFDDATSELQNAILELLENAGISTAINDKIIALIVEGETEAWNAQCAAEAAGEAARSVAEEEEARKLQTWLTWLAASPNGRSIDEAEIRCCSAFWRQVIAASFAERHGRRLVITDPGRAILAQPAPT